MATVYTVTWACRKGHMINKFQSYRGFMDVRVSHAKTPNKFSVQLLDKKDNLDRLYSKMQEYYDKHDSQYMEDDPPPYTA